MRKLAIVTAAAAAVVLSAGAWTGLAKADGAFLDPFPPDYPTGTVYEGMRALIIGGPGDNTTRCSADLEAGQLIATDAAKVLLTPVQAACDIATDPASKAIACVGLAGFSAAIVVAEFEVDACALQDGLIDSAEIEAGFENTKKLIALNTKIYEKQLEDNLLECQPIVGLILPEANGGLAEWVAIFVQERIDQYEPFIDIDDDRIAEAQFELNEGNVAFGEGRFEDAYEGYCDAYEKLAG